MAVFRLLARRAPDTVSAGDLAAALNLKASTLSVYVGILTRAGLVRQLRMGRFIKYGIELDQIGVLVGFIVNDCCRGRPEVLTNLLPEAQVSDPARTATQPFNVLFVCTGNSARSIFAEAILNSLGAGRFHAYSPGTMPYAQLHPMTLEVLRAKGHDAANLFPKDIDTFHTVTAPKMDFVFTVCDHAANEDCPPRPGQPVSAHWGMIDPIKAEGSFAERALAFQQTYEMMYRRLAAFVALPIASLGRLSLQQELDQIGRDRDS